MYVTQGNMLKITFRIWLLSSFSQPQVPVLSSVSPGRASECGNQPPHFPSTSC